MPIKELKKIKNWNEIPKYIKRKIKKDLTIDILERYDNPSYHDADIVHNILHEHGYKLGN